MVNGPRQLIYENQYFEIMHENSEKYLDRNIEVPFAVYLTSPQPAKVYVLNTEEPLELEITTPTGELVWPSAVAREDIGSDAKLLQSIKLTGTYTYYGADGEQVGESVPKVISATDGRIGFRWRATTPSWIGNHKKAGVVDNARNRPDNIIAGTNQGLYSVEYWQRGVAYTETLTYLDWWPDFIPYENDWSLQRQPAARPELRKWVYDVWAYGFNANGIPRGPDGWREASVTLEISTENE